MIGIIVNTCTIIVGTLIGSLLNRGVKEKYKEVLYTGLGLASLAIGLNATIVNLPKSQYPVLFIVSLALGGVIGTRLDIDGRFKKLVNRRSKGKGEAKLGDGLSTAILLYCIGPLSMLGPVISALKGDHTFLFTNATLDLVSSTVFASTYGFGMVLAAPVLFLWQGMFYVVAQISATAVSDELMSELLIVGGLMITGSGLGLLNLKDCKTLNLLPSLLVPVLWFLLMALWPVKAHAQSFNHQVQLDTLVIKHIDFQGETQQGKLICNKTISKDLKEIFAELYRQKYPIERIRPISEYNNDDEKSMNANNTSCYCYRPIKGTSKMSKHSLGLAVDINPLYNPCVRRLKNGTLQIQPSSGKPYVNRSKSFKYKITKQDLCYRLFIKHGFQWGGSWRTVKDYQHFEK